MAEDNSVKLSTSYPIQTQAKAGVSNSDSGTGSGDAARSDRPEELSVGGTPLPSLFNDPYTSLVHRHKLMTHLESHTRF
ncbi:hypothetical protein ANANG_G00135740 [Anguilla anguilla]|uniref:Uncharacterized protein n=1 Tax=Anguilla anguilla TaxID=7936 RepID=A0A9D3M9W0_ANGAN|nr:hypothetical protein ANANG_G00135740 [Anguilla anguilla]